MHRLLFLAVLFMAGNAPAAPSDLPKRKSGLWEVKISSGQAKGHAVQQCIDEKSDDLMKKEMSEKRQMQCSKNDMRREGDKVIAESVCKIQHSTATTRAVFTGDFNSAYKADIKSTYEPPLGGMKSAASTVEAKWLGPCKAGQKPGDIIVPGMPNRMDEMKKGASKRP